MYDGGGRRLEFHPMNRDTRPYIQELIEYNYNEDTKEGQFKFNGYYYVDDATELPKVTFLHMTLNEDEPYKVEEVDESNSPFALRMKECGVTCGMCTRYYFNELENRLFQIEIYKREKIKNTDVISTIDDDDGGEMDVCFFPTDIQIIYFRVLKEFNNRDDWYKGIEEVFAPKANNSMQE